MEKHTLKYWPVVRFFVKKKHKLSGADLEMILFLRGEGRFTNERFQYFNEIYPWQKNRFQSLMQRGWIHVFRKHNAHQKALYELSMKGHSLVTHIYKWLDGDLEISEQRQSNPLFGKDLNYAEKVQRNLIIKMNQENRANRPKNLIRPWENPKDPKQ